MKHLFVLLLLILPASSFAQNRVGNGGDSVVCRETGTLKRIQKAILLDLYEASSPLPRSTQKHEQILQTVFDKLQTLNPEQAEIYRRRSAELPKEIDYVKSLELANVEDSKHLVRPTEKNCDIEQVAIRKNLVVGEKEKRFLINSHIWDKMDETSKAGLLLHEIVYEHLWKLGDENSVKTRHLVAYYLSEDFPSVTREEYSKRLEKMKLRIYR